MRVAAVLFFLMFGGMGGVTDAAAESESSDAAVDLVAILKERMAEQRSSPRPSSTSQISLSQAQPKEEAAEVSADRVTSSGIRLVGPRFFPTH